MLFVRRKSFLCLAAFILVGVVFSSGFVFVREQRSRNAAPAIDFSADYIVRLRRESDTGAPFEVIRGDVLATMLDSGGILWYEMDEEIPLLDAGIGAESAEPETGSCYFESYQWNLAVIGAEAAFDRNAAGQGIRVGVIDSGVNPHPDFGLRLLPGHNYIEGAKNPDDTSDTLEESPVPEAPVTDLTPIMPVISDKPVYEDFTDLTGGAWYEEGVRWAIDSGIMNGVGGDLFNPNGSTTRAQVAAMLMRFTGLARTAFGKVPDAVSESVSFTPFRAADRMRNQEN